MEEKAGVVAAVLWEKLIIYNLEVDDVVDFCSSGLDVTATPQLSTVLCPDAVFVFECVAECVRFAVYECARCPEPSRRNPSQNTP